MTGRGEEREVGPELGGVDFAAARARLAGVVQRTPLVAPRALELPDDRRLDLRLKLECLQETGSFKARGAWNQVARLTEAQRARGVVAASSGNHGRALAWAAARAGVAATICMPDDAYPNKVEACRALGAEVVLGHGRQDTEARCRALVEAGRVLVHPYDAARTIEGAGTVGLELAEDWPEVEVVLVPVGGGGLIAGTSLALCRALGDRVRIVGVEPTGARTLGLALEAGRPVDLQEITTGVQGLCPLNVGALNLAAANACVDRVVHLADAPILAAQALLVNGEGLVVEPAGAATLAAALFHPLLAEWAAGRPPDDPLRVACVVSGGNPAPEQLAAVRAAGAGGAA